MKKNSFVYYSDSPEPPKPSQSDIDNLRNQYAQEETIIKQSTDSYPFEF